MHGDFQHATIACLKHVEHIQNQLNRISDAQHLPYSDAETDALVSSLTVINNSLQVTCRLLKNEIDRWGL